MENNLGQVVLVRDINPGDDDISYLYGLTELNGKLYFSARDGENGRELWVSDGTTEGTQLLVDINPGSSNSDDNYSSYIYYFTEFDGKLYFSADDGENGRELWVSDGTTEGTQLLLDINPGDEDSSYPYELTEFNGKLYFSARDGENGDELWVSDGTANGTQLLADINPNDDNGSSIRNLSEFNGKLYFSARDEENGKELWVSDGTTEGTQLLLDINPSDGDGSYPGGFTEFDGKLYFTASDGENGEELWVSDGTTEGTQLLLDINPGDSYNSSYPGGLTEFDGKLYFTASDGENGEELWVSDGTTNGTELLIDINPDDSYYGSYIFGFTEFNDKLYFSASDGETGNELWVSDGTTEGTQLLLDINPGDNDSSYPSSLTEFNDKLYFSASDGETGNELWVSDGTTEGTQLVSDINPDLRDRSYANSSYASNLIEFNGKLYFSASDGENGRELWVSDGTTNGTQLISDINENNDGFYYTDRSYLREFTEFNDKLYFSADDGENGRELWVSDGTTEGTQLLLDINPRDAYLLFSRGGSYFSYGDSSPDNFTEFNNKLYFSASNGENGRELWVSDGTAEGTQLLLDINPGGSYGYYSGNYYGNSSSPDDLTEFNGKLYFSASDGENGEELWVSDGTSEGTQLFVDLNPDGSSSPDEFAVFDEKLYFSASDGENGEELWVSDGTTNGTQLLVDINPGSNNGYPNSSSPDNFTEFNNNLYFTANDGENGDELWVSDGTSEGTQLLADINPGNSNGYPNSSNIFSLIEFNGKLYFGADDGENGRELWVSDGTTNGTQLLADINPDGNSYPGSFTVFDDRLYFSANDGENGREIWVSDGTTEGTRLAIDVSPNINVNIFPNNSNPRNLTVVDDELFFSADNGENGDELFKLTLDDLSNTIDGNNGGNNLLGTDDADLINGLGNNDTIDSGVGDDTINGGDGRDILNGEAGFDSLTGGVGQDTLDGGADNDILRGGERQDYLIGGTGDDRLFGDGSRDTLDGGAGNDTLTGGDRGDTFVLRSGEGRDTILDFQLGVDSIGLAGGLEFTDLTLSGNAIQAGNEVLAVLDDINTKSLSDDNFVTI